MEILNPGNVVPFYANIKSKMRYRAGCREFNWAIPVEQGKSPGMQFPVDAAPLGTYTMALLDENEDFVASPTSDYLLYSEDTEGNAWITIMPNIAFLTSLDCGIYSLKISADRSTTVAYSEDFRITNMTNKERAYRFEFYNDTDVDGIIYQGNYKQQFWLLNAIFDTPEIVEPSEAITNGDAVEVVVFQSVQRRDVLRFPNLPDFWQGVFNRLRMIGHFSITKLETGESWDLVGREFTVSSEEQDYCFRKGMFSWIASTQVMGGCEENKVMVMLNNSTP